LTLISKSKLLLLYNISQACNRKFIQPLGIVYLSSE